MGAFLGCVVIALALMHTFTLIGRTMAIKLSRIIVTLEELANHFCRPINDRINLELPPKRQPDKEDHEDLGFGIDVNFEEPKTPSKVLPFRKPTK